MFRKAISAEAYLRAGMVSEPLNMFDVAPNADGAAAVVLTRADLLPPAFPHPLVRISGSSVVTDTLALHDRPDPLSFQAVRLSTERACRQAGILPEDVNLFELHDAYSIYAALSLEAAGFAGRGQGWQMAVNGEGKTGSPPAGIAPDQHVWWFESARQPRRGNRRLPGGRGRPAAAWTGGRQPGARSTPCPGSIPGRSCFHRGNSRP
jgi:acetyl-CoA acetyltransferase